MDIGQEHDASMDAKAAARALGSLGGRARADALSPERRKEIAERAARKRWGARRKKNPKKRA